MHRPYPALQIFVTQSTLNKQEALSAGFWVKQDDIGVTEVGSLYKIDFNKEDSALNGTISLESRLSRLLGVDCSVKLQPVMLGYFAAYLGSDAQRLVKALLQREPTKRLGYGPQGSQNVQSHPFFKNINWQKLQDGKLSSPFKPTLEQDDSVENFDKIWTDQVRFETATMSTKLSLSHFEVLAGRDF